MCTHKNRLIETSVFEQLEFDCIRNQMTEKRRWLQIGNRYRIDTECIIFDLLFS